MNATASEISCVSTAPSNRPLSSTRRRFAPALDARAIDPTAGMRPDRRRRHCPRFARGFGSRTRRAVVAVDLSQIAAAIGELDGSELRVLDGHPAAGEDEVSPRRQQVLTNECRLSGSSCLVQAFAATGSSRRRPFPPRRTDSEACREAPRRKHLPRGLPCDRDRTGEGAGGHPVRALPMPRVRRGRSLPRRRVGPRYVERSEGPTAAKPLAPRSRTAAPGVVTGVAHVDARPVPCIPARPEPASRSMDLTARSTPALPARSKRCLRHRRRLDAHP